MQTLYSQLFHLLTSRLLPLSCNLPPAFNTDISYFVFHVCLVPSLSSFSFFFCFIIFYFVHISFIYFVYLCFYFSSFPFLILFQSFFFLLIIFFSVSTGFIYSPLYLKCTYQRKNDLTDNMPRYFFLVIFIL